jgi:hypothetical protein
LSIYQVAFYFCIFFLVTGSLLGLVGIWIDDFRKSAYSRKLTLTNWLFFATAIIVAIVTKVLGWE